MDDLSISESFCLRLQPPNKDTDGEKNKHNIQTEFDWSGNNKC